ncbi:hypothetical protein FIC_00376 [Flavobacteriaceae bacterium 3519-10]|nr:hypothetical protein FIC_00376 [Flavobacteriaceae bacterium 3519-10]
MMRGLEFFELLLFLFLTLINIHSKMPGGIAGSVSAFFGDSLMKRVLDDRMLHAVECTLDNPLFHHDWNKLYQ